MPGMKRWCGVCNLQYIDVRWKLVVDPVHYFARTKPLDPLSQCRRTASPTRKFDVRNLRQGVDSGIGSPRPTKFERPLEEGLRCPVKLSPDRSRIRLRLPSTVSRTVIFKGYFKCPHNKI